MPVIELRSECFETMLQIKELNMRQESLIEQAKAIGQEILSLQERIGVPKGVGRWVIQTIKGKPMILWGESSGPGTTTPSPPSSAHSPKGGQKTGPASTPTSKPSSKTRSVRTPRAAKGGRSTGNGSKKKSRARPTS